MAHILLFGGSFSPPTLAHEAIIRACLALPDFDSVWVMPSGDRADKRMSATAKDRLMMLQLLRRETFHDTARLKISDFELRLPQPNDTSSTIAALTKTYPRHTFCYVFGTDAYYDMPNWPDGAALQSTLPMVVVGRGADLFPVAPHITPLVLPQHGHISSTSTRAMVAAGHLEAFVSPAIADYIRSHRLYRTI